MYTVASALVELDKQLKKMPTHVYKMKWMWEALEKAKANLKPGEFLSEENFQVGLRISFILYLSNMHNKSKHSIIA